MTQDLGNPVCAPMEYTNANFQKMRDKLQEHFDSTMALEKLFKIDCDVEEMWNLYLDTLPQIMEVENRWHDCTACHRWFRKAANIVALTSDNQIITLWSGATIPEYEHVFDVFQFRGVYLTENAGFQVLAVLEHAFHISCPGKIGV